MDTKFDTEFFSNPYSGYQLNTQADISSTKDSLGYEPNFSLESGIKNYLPEIKRLYDVEIL